MDRKQPLRAQQLKALRAQRITEDHRLLAGAEAAARSARLAVWEGEGGALLAPAIPRTDPMTGFVSRQYFVGDQLFTDLGLAVAEHARQASADEDQSKG